MEKTLSIAEVVKTLCITTSESQQTDESKIELDFYFALASLNLNSLMALAACCEVMAKSDSLMPEIKDLMNNISENLHHIAYGLDDAIGQIADNNNYVGWSSIYEFEEKLKESCKKNGTKTTPV